MPYITPKTNWLTSDGIMNSDLNRIEGNTEDNHDAIVSNDSDIAGNVVAIDNNRTNILNLTPIVFNNEDIALGAAGMFGTSQGVYTHIRNTDYVSQNEIRVSHAHAFSDELYPGDRVLMSLSSELTKLAKSTWVVGDNNGGLCTGLTHTDDLWYYIFLVYDSSGDVTDIVFDSAYDGANIVANMTAFDRKRRIGSYKCSSQGSRVLPFEAVDGYTHIYGAGSDQSPLTLTLTLASQVFISITLIENYASSIMVPENAKRVNLGVQSTREVCITPLDVAVPALATVRVGTTVYNSTDGYGELWTCCDVNRRVRVHSPTVFAPSENMDIILLCYVDDLSIL